MLTNRAFLQVVESGSFSAASVELGISVASVVRQINSLEGRLGVRLLNRSTRALSLTEAGAIYRKRIDDLVRQLESLKRDISFYQKDVKGLLRVHLRHSVGTHVIVPALPEFLTVHPDLKVEITLTDEREDLIAQGVDVAVWLGSLDDSNLITRKLSRSRRRICCSPGYIAKHGLPAAPEDLAQHNCIVYQAKHYDNTWRLTRDGQTTTVAVSGNLESESSAVLLTSAMNGVGLAMLQEGMVRKAILSGDLIDPFPDYDVSSTDADVALYVVYPGSKQTSPKARAFIDFLVRLFRDM